MQKGLEMKSTRKNHKPASDMMELASSCLVFTTIHVTNHHLRGSTKKKLFEYMCNGSGKIGVDNSIAAVDATHGTCTRMLIIVHGKNTT